MSPRRIGLVVHPVRDVDGPRDVLLAWAPAHDIEVVALGTPAKAHAGLAPADAGSCDLVVAIGGDGTILGGARLAAAVAGTLPVLGVACGSLGMLAGTPASGLRPALDAFVAGDWLPRPLDGLRVRDETGADAVALNDVVAARKGAGQVKLEVLVGGERYVRAAGDGVVVSTAVGASAYGMAAGGPIVASGAAVLVVTLLAMHGGNAPALVVPSSTRVRLRIERGFSGCRVEVDGQPSLIEGDVLDLSLVPDHVTLVAFAGSEPYLTGLRRRSIVLDSPRIVGHDARTCGASSAPHEGPLGPASSDRQVLDAGVRLSSSRATPGPTGWRAERRAGAWADGR